MAYASVVIDLPSVMDLFCGAGGSALGFKKAGFSIALGVDVDSASIANFERNLDSRTLTKDMFNVKAKDLLKASELSAGETTLVLGCPPCQGFSSLNGSGDNDPRNALVHRFADIVHELHPMFFVFENVPGIMEEESYFGSMLERLEKAGYQTRQELVDMRDHGVPQRRKRVVVVGCRDRNIMARFSFPAPSHSRIPVDGRESWCTVRDAIKDLPPLAVGQVSKVPNHVAGGHTEKTMKRIRAVPKDGGSRRKMPKRLWYECHKGGNGFNDVMGRMAWDKPSPTITSGCCNPTRGRFLHPTANRAITPREAARLQTFPDGYVFSGTREQICSQIGNAFPPLYAEKLARNILKAIGSRKT